MFRWIKRLFGRTTSNVTVEDLARHAMRMSILRGDFTLEDEHRSALGLPKAKAVTTRELQNGPIDQQFGEDLRATTENLHSMRQWIERVANLEWEYGMLVPPELKKQARNDALVAVIRHRTTLRHTVEQHQRRAARIYRTSRAASLA